MCHLHAMYSQPGISTHQSNDTSGSLLGVSRQLFNSDEHQLEHLSWIERIVDNRSMDTVRSNQSTREHMVFR